MPVQHINILRIGPSSHGPTPPTHSTSSPTPPEAQLHTKSPSLASPAPNHPTSASSGGACTWRTRIVCKPCSRFQVQPFRFQHEHLPEIAPAAAVRRENEV